MSGDGLSEQRNLLQSWRQSQEICVCSKTMGDACMLSRTYLVMGYHEHAAHAEELLAAIAAATGERVCVPAERWALLLMLGLPAVRLFTTDTRGARIHAVLRHTVCNTSSPHQYVECRPPSPMLLLLCKIFMSQASRCTSFVW